MVVIDATMLMPLLRPDIPIPGGPSGTPIEKAKERIDHLVKELERDKTKIIVPTPALSEILDAREPRRPEKSLNISKNSPSFASSLSTRAPQSK